jgi:serine/threonine protein kinase
MDRSTMDEQSIFNDALEKRDRRERAVFLAGACGRDEVLRRRVEALLAMHDEAGDFLEHSPIHQGASYATTSVDQGPSRGGQATEPWLSVLEPSERANGLGVLGPYEVTGIIGRGGMGVVLKADDTRLRRTVALKLLAPELAANPTARKRFPREAQAAAAVVHRNVITIHAVGEEKDLPYLVMEYVDGISLHHKVDDEGPLALDVILRIGAQIADGPAAAHGEGLIHRDIKPANILLERGAGRVKITDFGLARAVDDLSVTRTGEVAGTPMFMSPEQANGEHVDHRTDLFSLGSVLYTMCTGRAPFRAESTIAVLRRVCDGTPRPMRELNPEIPEWLIEIIDRLLRKRPDERFQSAQEVSDLLRRHFDELRYPGPSRLNGTGPLVPGAHGQPRPGLDQFLADLRHVHRGDFSELVDRLSTDEGTPDAARVARELVRIKALTPYQAEALRQGKGQGLLVGPYLVLDTVGTHGTGTVFKVVHRQRRAVVALKRLPLSFPLANPAVMERFRREAGSLARIDHPNIVRCVEHVREVDGVCYHVMEYVEGRDLKSLVEGRGVFPVAQALECLLQAAKGLQSAHSLQIIHRDIRPANLMLDRTNTVRILDFGLARVMLPDPWGHDQQDIAASRAILGTIPYMAPEQADDAARADARSDIYSLGCTLHFLLTGRPPYRGRTWSEMFLAHRRAPTPSLKAARPSVPDYLDDLFARMLAKDPADRPRTMGSVIAAIEMAGARAKPASAATIPVLADKPDESDPALTVIPDDPIYEFRPVTLADPSPVDTRSWWQRYRREFRLIAWYLLLTAALVAALIILLEFLLGNARGAEPIPATTEDRAPVCVRPPSRRSSMRRPSAWRPGRFLTGSPPPTGRTTDLHTKYTIFHNFDNLSFSGLVEVTPSAAGAIEVAGIPRASMT